MDTHMIDHVDIRASDVDASRAFYEAALEPLGYLADPEIADPAGGRTIGDQGLRAECSPGSYGAFVLDPDGNNVEAVCHRPA